MANVSTINVGVTAEVDQAQKNILDLSEVIDKALKDGEKKHETSANKISEEWKHVKEIAEGIGLAKAVEFAIDKMKELTGESYKLAIEADHTQLKFEALVGNATDAEEVLSKIEKMKISKLFGGSEIKHDVSQLIAAGNSAEAAMQIVGRLASLAAITDKPVESIRVLTDTIVSMQTKGSISVKQLKQSFAEFGINAEEVLSKRLGISMLELEKKVSEGAVSSEEVIQELLGAIGTKFPDGVDKAYSSLSGLEQRIKVQTGDTLESLGKAFVKAFNWDDGKSVYLDALKWVEAHATGIMEALAEVYKGFKDIIDFIVEHIPDSLKSLEAFNAKFVEIALKIQEEAALVKLGWEHLFGNNESERAAFDQLVGIQAQLHQIDEIAKNEAMAKGFRQADADLKQFIKNLDLADGTFAADANAMDQMIDSMKEMKEVERIEGIKATKDDTNKAKYKESTDALERQRVALIYGEEAAKSYDEAMKGIFNDEQLKQLADTRLLLDSIKIENNNLNSFDKAKDKAAELGDMIKRVGLNGKAAGAEMLKAVGGLSSFKVEKKMVDSIEAGSSALIEADFNRKNNQEELPTLQDMLTELKAQSKFQDKQNDLGQQLVTAINKMNNDDGEDL